ncbi:MAG: UDP-N-acetylglucosamine 2-epimerase (non-hydrolyzing) [Candidatus Omnitrophica bacterium]|nr:UDP-N-acetylglucosamine 2-epimerase (non-hydrolyzing) [Candidatus Omnitrophota bacterium]
MVKKVLFVFGTRPEAIKMAPVIKELEKHPDAFTSMVCVTAQHREMLDQFLALFNIKPDIDLDLMEKNQTLDSFTAKALVALSATLKEVKPHVVLVQGDTTTAMTAALAAFYQKIPVGHIEAGLRTNNIYNPFPEEANRNIIGKLATYNFAPTEGAKNALLKEDFDKDSIFVTGNSVVDALQMILKNIEGYPSNIDTSFLNGNKLILVTAHRRENFGKPLENICAGLMQIVKKNEDVEIIYPVHLNPNVKNVVDKILANKDRIHLFSPVEYFDLVRLLNKAHIVITDSGGIQEEAPALGKPVLVLRSETERPEGVEAGVAKLIGTNSERIVSETELLLHNSSEYFKMSKAVSPYGDGKASSRIIEILMRERTDNV